MSAVWRVVCDGCWLAREVRRVGSERIVWRSERLEIVRRLFWMEGGEGVGYDLSFTISGSQPSSFVGGGMGVGS